MNKLTRLLNSYLDVKREKLKYKIDKLANKIIKTEENEELLDDYFKLLSKLADLDIVRKRIG